MRPRNSFPALWAIALGLSTAPPAAAQEPPRVEVTFHIQERALDPRARSQLISSLSGAHVRDAQQRISTLLAGYCKTYFGFVSWEPVVPSKLPSRGVPRLTLRVRDQADGGIELVFFKTLDQREEVLDTLAPSTLIPSWEPARPVNADQLYDLVADKLNNSSGFFSRDVFRLALHSAFVKKIPLTTEVFTIPDVQRVVIPLLWDRLKPGSKSVFEVQFVAICGEPQPTMGTMTLSSVLKRVAQPYRGMIQSQILTFDCAPLTLNAPGAWDPEIPRLLERRSVQALQVHMETYVGGEALDGLIIDPH